MRRRNFLTMAAVGGVGAGLGFPAFVRGVSAATPRPSPFGPVT